jgi:rRNA maturation endonuclease Nob1
MKMKTTFEMDGLLTPEDVARRHSVFMQCRGCSKWSKTDSRLDHHTCEHCGGTDFDPTSITSERTFNPLTKRKVKVKK